MTSEKQIEANRINAKKGGVKTPTGKSVSKLNAIKHGILSEDVTIQRGLNWENPCDYDDQRNALVKHLQPVGPLEEMQVDQLFSLHWRLRRVAQAERALIEQAILSLMLKDDLAYTKSAIKYDQRPNEEDVARLQKSKTSMVFLELVRDAKQIIHFIEHGYVPLPVILKDRISANFGVDYELSELPQEILACNEAIQKKEYHGKDETYYQKQILVAANSLLKLVQDKAMTFLRREEAQYKAELEAMILPNEQDAQRIQRYESHLHRLFQQTLHELQRLQSARMGKPAPLAAALDVTMNNENGFVS